MPNPVATVIRSTDCIGIVAGAGNVPLEIADAISASGGDVYIVAISDTASPEIARYRHDKISLGQVGRLIKLLRDNGCEKIIISGSLERPDFKKLRLDFGFFRYLFQVLALMRGGDDHVLRLVVKFFEGRGFQVLGIADVAPVLLATEGAMTETPVPAPITEIAAIGYRAIVRLAQFDIGQAVLVRDQQVVAIEAVEGTDAMLQRVAATLDQASSGSQGLLVKATKPDQEMRVDLPTIGPMTVQNCSRAAINCIAVEAGRSVIAQRADTLAAAQQTGVAIVGMAHRLQVGSPDTKAPGKEITIACLTRLSPNPQAIKDATQGLRILAALDEIAPNGTVVVSREHALAVGVKERPGDVVTRAAQLRQWGDKRRKTPQGIVAINNPADLSDADYKLISECHFAGLVLAHAPDLQADTTDLVQLADRIGLFIVVPA